MLLKNKSVVILILVATGCVWPAVQTGANAGQKGGVPHQNMRQHPMVQRTPSPKHKLSMK